MQTSALGTQIALSLFIGLTMLWAGLSKRRLEWKSRRHIDWRRRR